MRHIALAGAVSMLAWPALADIEPQPVASDPRVVEVLASCPEDKPDCPAYKDGEPINIRGKVGQTLMLVFPPGWVVNTSAPSDEHIIRGITVKRDGRPGKRDGGAPNEGPVEPPDRGGSEMESDTKCQLTDSLSLCVTRGRFYTILASIAQSRQPLPLLLLFRKQGKPDIEKNIDILFETVPDPAPPKPVDESAPMAARKVGTGETAAKPAQHFSTVHIRLPVPGGMAPAAPQTAPQRVYRAPARVTPTAPIAQSQPQRNRNYTPSGSLGSN